MKLKLVILPMAQVDLYDTAEHISLTSVENARRFLASAHESFDDLLEMPGLGSKREFSQQGSAELRSWRIHDFENWLVFYRVVGETVEILRVLHGARDVEGLIEGGSV